MIRYKKSLIQLDVALGPNGTASLMKKNNQLFN